MTGATSAARKLDEQVMKTFERIRRAAAPLVPTGRDRVVHLSRLFPNDREKKKALEKKSGFARDLQQLIRIGRLRARAFPLTVRRGRFYSVGRGWMLFLVVPSDPHPAAGVAWRSRHRLSPFRSPSFDSLSLAPTLLAQSLSRLFAEHGFQQVALQIESTAVEGIVRLRIIPVLGRETDPTARRASLPTVPQVADLMIDDLRRVWGHDAVEVVDAIDEGYDSDAAFLVRRAEPGSYRRLRVGERAGGPDVFTVGTEPWWTPPLDSIALVDSLGGDTAEAPLEILIQSHLLPALIDEAYLSAAAPLSV